MSATKLIYTEIQLGRMFLDRADAAADEVTRMRHRKSARQAYEAAVRVRERSALSDADARRIDELLARLRGRLGT